MKAKGEQCSVLPSAQAATVHVTFKLDASTFAPSDPVTIKFPGPMSSKPQNRAWVTIVEAGKPASTYGVWTYVDDGAVSAKLVAPTAPGDYEVRLHTEYPAKSFNVVHTAPIKIAADAQPVKQPATKWRFSIKTKSVAPGEAVELAFAQPMEALPNEKFWVTVVKPDQSPDSYGWMRTKCGSCSGTRDQPAWMDPFVCYLCAGKRRASRAASSSSMSSQLAS